MYMLCYLGIINDLATKFLLKYFLQNWQSNDDNKRPPLAASNNTTEVDADVTESLLAVRRLGGKHGKRRCFEFCLFAINQLFDRLARYFVFSLDAGVSVTTSTSVPTRG